MFTALTISSLIYKRLQKYCYALLDNFFDYNARKVLLVCDVSNSICAFIAYAECVQHTNCFPIIQDSLEVPLARLFFSPISHCSSCIKAGFGLWTECGAFILFLYSKFFLFKRIWALLNCYSFCYRTKILLFMYFFDLFVIYVLMLLYFTVAESLKQ